MKRVLAGLILCASVVQAQETYEKLTDLPVAIGMPAAPKAGPTCTGGIAYDDGTFENGYRLPFTPSAQYVQRFGPAPFPARAARVCVAWQSGLGAAIAPFNFLFFDDDGPNGTPGTLLGVVPSAVSISQSLSPPQWVGADCAEANIRVPEGGNLYAGVQWDAFAEVDLFLAGDESLTTARSTMYSSANGATWTPLDVDVRALGVRLEWTRSTPPSPPAGSWMTSPDMPDFRFKVRLTAGGTSRTATQVADCVEQTVCAAGVFPDRPEVLLRVVGPRSNGYLWPIVIRFTNSQVEAWIEQLSSGEIKYYNLDFIGPDSDELSGVNDRFGFLP